MGFAGRASLLALLVAALAISPASARQPPPATFDVAVDENVYVPTRDGTKLAADIFRPVAAEGKRFPCLVELTPYRKEMRAEEGAGFFPGRGFVLAEIDARGTGGSEGEYDAVFSPTEQRDTYDAIEWLATEYPWCNGKVGMWGGSYSGIIQYLTAALQPPHLRTIAPQRAYSDLYRDIVYTGGIVTGSFGALWSTWTTAFNAIGADLTTGPPLEQAVKALVHHHTRNNPMLPIYLNHPFDGPLYRDSSVFQRLERIRVPVFHIAGFFDSFTRGQLNAFSQLRELERQGRVPGPHHLLVGPWSHTGTHALAYPRFAADLLAWYRHWLDGGPKPRFMRTNKRARWFEMSEARNGAGAWRRSRTWPPDPGSFRTLYLRDGGGLSAGKPEPDEEAASLRSDPLAGITEWPSKWDDAAGLVPMSDADQRPDEARGLTFTTPELGRDLVVAGPIALHLEAATRPLDGGLGTEAGLLLDTITGTLGEPGAGQVLPPRLDADWVIKLSDVAPDGTSTLIQSGFLRASHRRLGPKRTIRSRGKVLVPWHTHRAKHVEGLKAGKPYSLDIEVWPTAKRFVAGHRLRIAIYHADTPNHLTQLRAVQSTISLERARPSYLLLGKP